MRIIHAIRTTRLEYGGPARSAMDLAESLSAAGHEACLVTACARDVPSKWCGGGPSVCEVRTWPGERGFLTPSGLRTAKEAIRRADLVHIHEVWEVFNCQIASLARRHGVPYCVSPRGSLDAWSTGQKNFRKQVFHAMASGSVLRGAAFIHCTADREARESGRWFGDRPAVVLPNLLDLTALRTLPGPGLAMRTFGIGEGDKVLLFLSRLQPGKGLQHIVRALPAVLAAEPRALLIVAGEGSSELRASLERESRELEVSSRVRFVGFVKGETKVSLTQCAKMFLLPSSHENFGNALFEAAACGAPLLVSPGVATADLLEAAGAAVTVAPDPTSIAHAAIDCLRAPEPRWQERSDRIRAWALDYLSPERILRGYVSAYEHAARTAGGSG